jgi:hypothetical protein
MADDPISAEEEEEAEYEPRHEARAALPAVYVDTWATAVWSGQLRLILGEWLGKQPHYRAALVMELKDAKKLGRSLLRRVAAQEEKDELAATDAQGPEGEC